MLTRTSPRPPASLARQLACVLAALSLGAQAMAHDFWLQPSLFSPKSGELVKFKLHVGDEFPGEIVPRDNDRIELFAEWAPGSTTPRPVVGRDGDRVAGIARYTEPGTHVVAFRSAGKELTLEPAKFESYLREEGLEAVAALRASRGQTDQPGREKYSRCCKTLVCVGGAGAPSDATRTTGLKLEITPVSDPRALKPGDDCEFIVTFDAKPLAGALLGARSPGATDRSARTDEHGRVKLKLDASGMWLVHTVHMVDAPKSSGVDWESTWSSLTFEIAPAAGSGPQR